MKVKEESEKVGLKLNIQKTKIMASGPITSWEIDSETVSDFIFGGSKITADGDCSHEIKNTLGKLVNISEPHIPDFKMEKQYLLHGIAVRNIDNLRYADDTTLMAESEELKNLLMKVKGE